MATTTNYGFEVPDDTDLVKDGAAAMRELGQDVDTQLFTALGGDYPGLRLVKKQTIGSGVSSVVVNDAFSATYDAYKIVVSSGVGSTAGANIGLQLGASTANYAIGLTLITYATAALGGAGFASTSSFPFVGHTTTNYTNVNVDLVNPFLAKYTTLFAQFISAGQGGTATGVHNVATSYTSFTLIPGAATLTGGTIYVYGYGIS
jgi:hypothetical protein